MEKPPKPKIISRADSYFSRTGLTLEDETNDLGTYLVDLILYIPVNIFSHVGTGVFLGLTSTSFLLKDTTHCLL